MTHDTPHITTWLQQTRWISINAETDNYLLIAVWSDGKTREYIGKIDQDPGSQAAIAPSPGMSPFDNVASQPHLWIEVPS
jgi:hypothetical protein